MYRFDNMVQEHDLQEIVDRDGWKSTPYKDHGYSSDDLIDAYLKGKDEGISLPKKILAEKVSENLKKSADVTQQALTALSQSGLNVEAPFLRIASLKYYEVLFPIHEDQFLDDKILDMYGLFAGLQANFESEFYSVDLSFCPFRKKLNTECLAADGYVFKFSGKHE